MTVKNDLEGLKGWLVLVGIGLIASPLIIINSCLPAYAELVTHGRWAVLTTEGSPGFDPLWAPIILAEATINFGLVCAWVVAAVLFFAKRRQFPRVYIGLLLFTLAFILPDAVAIRLVMPNEPIFDPGTVKQLARTLATSVVWIPYMLVSKRVQATFVH